jgi:asparagine synthase (glutamine-hydrolysing)
MPDGLLVSLRSGSTSSIATARRSRGRRDGRWLLCYNGEVFSYRALAPNCAAWALAAMNTEILLEAFSRWGERAVTRLRGEFAFVIVDRRTAQVYLARDQLGVKPLYWSASESCLHVASEIKALVGIGAPISCVPPGHHGWASAGTEPSLAPYSALLSPANPPSRIEDPDEAAVLLRAALADSIAVRADTDLTVGVILSGGLDSSLVLRHVQAVHPDCVAITIGAPGSEDIAYARRLTAELAVPHEVIEISPSQLGRDDVREAIRVW